MVTNITSFGRSGLSDWLMQRVSAVILALYTVFVVAYLLFNPNLDYYTWSGLFEPLPYGDPYIASIVLFSLVAAAKLFVGEETA